MIGPRPPRPVGLLIAAMLLAGGALDAGAVHMHPGVALVTSWSALAMLAAFAVTESVVLHVELGQNAISVSLSEMPLVVGLFLVPVEVLGAARLIAGVAVLIAIRRQPPVKVAFNASLWVLDVAVAAVVFRALHGAFTQGWAVALPGFAAAVTAAVLDSVAVMAVIALTSRELRRPDAVRFLVSSLLGATMSSTIGLVVVGAVSWDRWLLLPVAISATLLMGGFHAFSSLRQRHSDVKLLYEFTGELSRAGDADAVLRTVLRRTRDLLNADTAMLYLREGADGLVECTRMSGDTAPVASTQPAGALPALLHGALEMDAPLVIPAADRRGPHRAFLQECGLRDAVLAPVIGEQDLRGVLVVGDRHGDVSSFGDEAGLLAQTLATHAAAALANSRLVHRLNHESRHDALTGLANRAYFQHRLGRLLAAGTNAAVLLMDLDRFKEVNDTLGHHHGDLVLNEVARRLGAQLRQSDLLARLGGDEFAVLMVGASGDEALATAERLRYALAQPMHLQGVAMEVAASIGVVLAPEHGSDASTIMLRADVAMYTAKRQYGQTQVYAGTLDEYSPRRLALAGGLRGAIEQGQLTLHYQPQVRSRDDAVVGAEALVRWEHPRYGLVGPDEFISVAEQTGQIRELTRFVLDRALQECASWSAAGFPMAVSVNVSVRNLLEPDLTAAVRQLLDGHGVSSSQLTLEITESHLMADPGRTVEMLEGLARLGVRLSIDDFGTGYSSLSYLKQLPVSEVKVDKSFVAELTASRDDAAIVEAIVHMAHTLRLEVVAEGVEDARAQDVLVQLGCDVLQGYHLGRPMSGLALRSWLASRRVAPRRAALRGLPPATRLAGAGRSRTAFPRP